MRLFTVTAAAMLVLTLIAGPATAHNLTVSPHGADEHVGWIGGGTLPETAQGQGLIVIGGGPDAGRLQPPSHGLGLNRACEANEANPSVVDIRGPGPSCPHGQ